YALRLFHGKRQGNISADRQPHNRAALDACGIQHRQYLLSHALDGPWPSGLRAAEAGEVDRNHSVAIGEELQLRPPHRVVKRKRVDEKNCWSLSFFDVIEHSLGSIPCVRTPDRLADLVNGFSIAIHGARIQCDVLA